MKRGQEERETGRAGGGREKGEGGRGKPRAKG